MVVVVVVVLTKKAHKRLTINTSNKTSVSMVFHFSHVISHQKAATSVARFHGIRPGRFGVGVGSRCWSHRLETSTCHGGGTTWKG